MSPSAFCGSDQMVAGSSPGRIIFFSTVNFPCWLLSLISILVPPKSEVLALRKPCYNKNLCCDHVSLNSGKYWSKGNLAKHVQQVLTLWSYCPVCGPPCWLWKWLRLELLCLSQWLFCNSKEKKWVMTPQFRNIIQKQILVPARSLKYLS